MKKVLALTLALCVFMTFTFSGYGEALADDPYMLEYATLSEPTEQEQIEDAVYNQLYEALGNDYMINVQAFYESKEAIEEGLYNSKETEYFGYLLSEVDAQFEGTPYVFTMDGHGETIVQELVPYDDTWDKVLTNVAIGAGVILVCVTVSSLTVAAAPAVHMIFACAAKTAVQYGAIGAGMEGIKSAVSTFIETGDIEQSLKSAALGASEGFKWGAIGGAIKGGTAKAINLAGLKRATHMTMNEVAEIQKSGLFTDATIKQMHSMEEFKVYQDANLMEYEMNGRRFLLPKDFDCDFVDPATGMTNRQLIADGLNPVDHNGIKYQLHHVGQKTDSPLALLTQEQHQQNTSILHVQKVSEVRPNGNNNLWLNDKKEALKCLSFILDIFF